MAIRFVLLVLACAVLCPDLRASQDYPTIAANQSVMDKPIDLVIADDETRAILRTSSLSSATMPPFGYGRVYLFDLSDPTALPFVHASPSTDLGQDYVATIGDYCITHGGASGVATATGNVNPEVAIFGMNPPTLLWSIPDRLCTDVAVQYHPTSGNPLGIVKREPLVSVFDLTTGAETLIGVPTFQQLNVPVPKRMSAAV